MTTTIIYVPLLGSDGGICANVVGVGAKGETDFEDAAAVVEQDDKLAQIMERAWAFLFIKQLHKKYQASKRHN